MSCDNFEVGTKVEAVHAFQVREALAAPVGQNVREVQVGDTGEVVQKRIAGNFHWLGIRWHRLRRTLNLEPDQFDYVKIIEE